MRQVNFLIPLLLFTSLLIFSGCQKDEEPLEEISPIDPATQPSELSRALGIAGSNREGDMPAPTENAIGRPELTHTQPSASVTNDNTVYIPFAFEAQEDIETIFLQVTNADNYWQIPVLVSPGEESHVFQVFIPAHILEGEFRMDYAIGDAAGHISESATLNTRIVPPVSFCEGGDNTMRVEGTDGLTIQTFYFNNAKGMINLEYEMYSKPDRMDIFYNGKWVSGTGNEVAAGTTPPSSQCHDGTNGFTGGEGVVYFYFDSEISNRVDVYLSGCFGGTKWYYDIFCPEAWYADLPACPCDYFDPLIQEEQETNNPQGQWQNCGEISLAWGDFHHGAHFETRWIPVGWDEPGQQCTYDEYGRLITSGIGAGSPDMDSPDACEGLSGYDSDHIEKDVDTWKTIPCIQYLQAWPSNNANGCDPKPLNDIRDRLHLVGNMTCEEITLLITLMEESEDTDSEFRNYFNNPNSGFSNNYLKEQLKILSAETGCSTPSCNPASFSDDECGVIARAYCNLL